MTKIKIKIKILLSCRFRHSNSSRYVHMSSESFFVLELSSGPLCFYIPGHKSGHLKSFGLSCENMFTVRIMDWHSVLTIKPLNGMFFPFFVAYARFICSSPWFITVRMDTAYHIMTNLILSWNTLPRFFVEIVLRHGMDRFLIVPYFIRHGWWQICTFPVLSHHF